ALRDQHLVDHSFADDLIELVLHLSAKRFESRLRTAPEFLGIGLGNNGTDAILNQGPAGLDRFFYFVGGFTFRDRVDVHVVEKRASAHFVGRAELQDEDFNAFLVVRARSAVLTVYSALFFRDQLRAYRLLWTPAAQELESRKK